MRSWLPWALVLGLTGLAPAEAKVVKVEVESRETVLGGREFGQYGPYELLLPSTRTWIVAATQTSVIE